MAVVLRVKYDDAGTKAKLERLVMMMEREAQAVMVDVADRIALPVAKRAARSPYRGMLKSVPSTRGATIRVVGPKLVTRIAGWLEFGGAIRGKKIRVGFARYTDLETRKVKRGKAIYDLNRGLMTFQVDGRWVSKRIVTRPIDKRGRYVGRALEDPALIRRVERDIKTGMDQVLDRYLSPAAEVR